MMKRGLVLTAFFLWIIPNVVYGWTGSIKAFMGTKVLEERDWRANHREIGILCDMTPGHWPVGIAAGLLYSTGKGSSISGYYLEDNIIETIEGNIVEINVGIQINWEELRNLRSFLAGGVALIYAEQKREFLLENSMDSERFEDDDTGVGAWIGGGLDWLVSDHLIIGINLRWSEADVFHEEDIQGVVEVGGGHAGLTIGYQF